MADTHLYLHTPVAIFAARINMASVTYPVATLTFDGVTTGAYTDIQTDMTLLLGTSAGADDLGRVRVQNVATSTTIPIGRTSQGLEDGELTIEDDAYITVLDDYRVWSKIPYIDSDGNQYKDTNIAVGDYTGTDIPPVANCGPGFADYIDGDDIITVEFDASNSFAVADGETIDTYAWDIKDGTVLSGDLDEVTLIASFPAGFRWVALTVVDTNGIPHTARCPVLAVDAAADVTLPHVEPELSITPQGQRLTLRVTQDIPRSTYPDGTLVMFWEGSSGDPDDRSQMQFIGWEQSNNADARATRTGLLRGTQLQCVDVAGRLASLPGFPQSLERAETVDNWDKMVNPTMDKYIHYILLWHSTALSLADYFSSGTGDDYPFVIFASEGESLYDQVENEAKGLIPTHHFTCNRRGQLQVVPDPMLQPIVDRTATLQGNFTEATIASIRFAYTRPPRTHWLRGHALLTATDYTDVDGTPTLLTVHCIAPGDAPGQGVGEVTTSEGLARSQSALNVAKGHEYARLNARHGPISVTPTVDEDFDAVDPADLEWVALTITSATDAQRGLTFDDMRCQVKEIRRRWTNTRTGTVRHGEFTLEVETSGAPAMTVTPVGAPDIEPAPTIAPSFGLLTGVELVAAIDGDPDGGCLYRTADFQTDSGSGGPTWERIDPGITDVRLFSFVVDPFSPGYINMDGTGEINGWAVGEEHVYRIEDVFGTPSATIVLTFATVMSTSSLFKSRTIQASFGRFFSADADNPWLLVVSQYANQSGHTGTWVIYSVDAGITWSTEIQVTAHYDSDLSGAEASALHGVYLSPKTPGLAYIGAYTSTANPAATDGYVSTDWGATWSQIANPDIQPGNRPMGAVHVPWEDNDDETIVYHGHITRGASLLYRLKRIEADGTTITDISPVVSARNYGVNRTGFGIRAYDSDRTRVVLGGTGNDSTALTTGDFHGVFISNDEGDTWSTVVTPIADNQFTRVKGFSVAFGGDDSDVLFVWGRSVGADGCISYSDDFGATLDDRSGNIASDWGGGGQPDSFLAIMGGPITA